MRAIDAWDDQLSTMYGLVRGGASVRDAAENVAREEAIGPDRLEALYAVWSALQDAHAEADAAESAPKWLEEAPTVEALAGARREHEVFALVKVGTFHAWQRCQHGRQIVTVLAHWSDDAPFTVTTGHANHTQAYERVVHADGSPTEGTGWCYGTHRRCPTCGELDTLTTAQEAWLDRTTCSTPGCAYEHVYMIGD